MNAASWFDVARIMMYVVGHERILIWWATTTVTVRRGELFNSHQQATTEGCSEVGTIERSMQPDVRYGLYKPQDRVYSSRIVSSTINGKYE